MAKKQTDTAKPKPADPVAAGGEAAAEGAQTAPKAREAKTKEPRAAQAKTKEPKAKEGKVREAKPAEPKPKTAPATAAGALAPEAAGSAAVAGEKTAPTAPEPPLKKKGKAPGTAPPRGKKLKNHLRNLKQKLRKQGPIPVQRAVGLLKQMKRSKFDETVEVHMSLGIDTSQNDQMVRGSVPLPHGIGKAVRILVFCQGENVAKAKAAGADYAGSDEFIHKIQKEGWLEFDVALATQDMMGMVSRLGKVLGPRGLMPTPKAGTVITGDVAAAVREFKAGKVEYRADKGGNVHAGVGKLSFDDDKLAANVTAFVDQVRAARPAAIKGNYIKSITLSATMSPGVRITV